MGSDHHRRLPGGDFFVGVPAFSPLPSWNRSAEPPDTGSPFSSMKSALGFENAASPAPPWAPSEPPASPPPPPTDQRQEGPEWSFRNPRPPGSAWPCRGPPLKLPLQIAFHTFFWASWSARREGRIQNPASPRKSRPDSEGASFLFPCGSGEAWRSCSRKKKELVKHQAVSGQQKLSGILREMNLLQSEIILRQMVFCGGSRSGRYSRDKLPLRSRAWRTALTTILFVRFPDSAYTGDRRLAKSSRTPPPRKGPAAPGPDGPPLLFTLPLNTRGLPRQYGIPQIRPY